MQNTAIGKPGNGEREREGNALAATAADDARQLLLAFDRLCAKEGISYFAIEDTLVGAFCYQDLVPGEPRLKVGMLRNAFRQLEAAAARQHAQAGLPELDLTLLCDGPAAAQVGNSPTLELHVFDTLTDDYDLSRFQVWSIRMDRKLAKRLSGGARKLMLRRAAAIAARYENSPTDAVSNLYEKDAHSIPRCDVSQTQRIPFANETISAPIKPDTWVETDLDEVRRRTRAVQADLLLIMSEIDRVCRECDIGYFLCAGTLLGAMRYDGFIPWDDDADLGMLRPDFERFVACAQERLGERFFVQTWENEPDAPYLYAKVRLIGTEYITRWLDGHDVHPGISVDIFPFDLAPVDEPGFDGHLAEANRLAKAHKSLANHRVSADMPHRKAKGLWEHAGHAVMALLHARYRLKSSKKTAESYRAHVSKFNGDLQGGFNAVAEANRTPRYAASYVAYFTYLSVDDLLPYREVTFEHLSLLAPANPEALMTMQFGDYLQEPPVHKRRGHPVLRWRASDGQANA